MRAGMTATVMSLAIGVAIAAAQPAPLRWTFDDLPAGQPPAGFSFARTGKGTIGTWEVVDATSAGGGKALARLDDDAADVRFPLAIADTPSVGDNTLERNGRLYVVEAGRRRQLASWDGEVPRDAWTALAFEARGDRLVVWWGDRQVLEHRDATFDTVRRVGLWTQADSVTWFDDLVVASLE